MDKKRSLLNVSISIGFKIIILIFTILTRRYLIEYVGNSATGLFSLYTSIIGFLAVADLGVGSAITFCMYKPIVENDTAKVSALYRLFIKLYRIIGLIILVAGLLIMPALPYLAKDYDVSINLYSTFALMLLSIVINYLFSAKTSLINAYKDNYVTTTINSVGLILQYILQIVLVIVFKSFELYLTCAVLSMLFQWILTEIFFRKKHKELLNYNQKLDIETKQEVVKKTKAMFMHKIGGLLVNTADSIIISAFVGVILLGKYANYTTIMVSMTGVITLFFTPLTSVIGHLCAKGDVALEKKYFKFFFIFNFVTATIFFLGYYATIDDLIVICFQNNESNDLVLGKEISFVITLNYFIQFMRNAVLLFRDATGTFYQDRFKPILEGTVNIILSILFVQYIGIVGVIVATIVTNILICHIVEPLILYKYGFSQSPKKYYLVNYIFIIVFTLLLVLLSFITVDLNNVWLDLLLNGLISIALAMIPIIIILIVDKDTRCTYLGQIRKIKIKLKK